MKDKVVNAIEEYRNDHTEPATVFLHPSSHHELQKELAEQMRVFDDYFRFDVQPDFFIDEDDIIVLPEDVHDCSMYHESPPLHHVRQVLGDVEQQPYEQPSESLLLSKVPFEVNSVTLEFEYEKIIEHQAHVPELPVQRLNEDPRNIDIALENEVDGDIWRVHVDYDDYVLVPVSMLGLGDVDYDNVETKMCEAAVDTINDTLTSPIESTYHEMTNEPQPLGVEDGMPCTDDTEIEQKTLDCGERTVQLGRMMMRPAEEVA